jgi:glycosyltransferase involved in cell wall biosynthesis
MQPRPQTTGLANELVPNGNASVRNILIVCAGYPPDMKGGGEKSTQIIAQALSRAGHTVTVLTCAATPTDKLDTDKKTRVISVCSPNTFWSFNPPDSKVERIVWHLLESRNRKSEELVSRTLADVKPEIVLTSTLENFGASAWLACNKHRIPVIHILRSYYLLCYKSTMYSQKGNCGTACMACRLITKPRRQTAKNGGVQGVIGISKFILNAHKQIFQATPSRVIHNPTQINQYKPSSDNKKIIFGYLGRIEKEKGTESVLRAFNSLQGQHELIVAGRGDPAYEQQLKSNYAHKSIKFLGWVDPATVYRSIDYVIVPSTWKEPFGRIVIEAYSYGVPVIAAATGGITELVNDGIEGFLFNPGDEQSLLAALNRAISLESREKMKKNAFNKAKEFSEDSISAEYIEFIEEVINNSI